MRLLSEIAERYPLGVALIAGHRRWTWGDIRERAMGVAVSLRTDYGIETGAIVATQLGNTAEHVILLHAIWAAGAAVAPLNTRLLSMERDRQLEHLRPALFLHDVANPIPDPILNVRCAFAADILDADVHAADVHDADVPAADVPDAQASAYDVDFSPGIAQLCSVLFTSGSSGMPKAVSHSWDNHRASAAASAANLGVYDDDNWQCVIPLYHIGGLAIITRSLLYGTTMTLHDGFDIAAVLQALRNDGVRITSLVPTMLHRLLAADATFSSADLPQLRAILLGGAPATTELWTAARARGLPVLGTYGLTESCSQVVTGSPRSIHEDAGTAGRPLENVDIQLCDDNGRLMDAGTEGEIWLRGPMMTAGYLHHEGLNAQRFVDGWFRTGDVGVLDDTGHLRVLARREDLIISGGENIYPAEVTDVLLRHPEVADAAVIGIDDAEWGQRPAAVVVLRSIVQDEVLEQWCRNFLAGYKVPQAWRVVDALPRTEVGKLRSGEMRKMFLGNAT
jgi:O-succinylbenzoic acid--CoA ligase